MAELTEDDIRSYFDAAEAAIIDTQIARAKDGPLHPKSQWASWKSGPAGINPINYGALAPFLAAANRADDKRRKVAKKWIADLHIPDLLRCFDDTLAGQGEPPGEGSMVIGGKCVSWDSDINRHTTCVGLADCLEDRELLDLGLQDWAVKTMLTRWGDWLINQRWMSVYRRQHRIGLPILSLASIYRATQDEKYLAAAQALFWLGFGDQVTRKVQTLSIWDTGHPRDKDFEYRGWGSEDVFTAPWYDGNNMHAFLELYQHAGDWLKPTIMDRMVKMTEWYVPERCPVISERYGQIVNTKLQGGLELDSPTMRARPESIQVTPEQWMDLDDDEQYMRLGSVEAFESIEGYGDREFFDDMGKAIGERKHHQGRLDGPRIQMHGSCWGIVPLLTGRAIRTGNETDLLQAIRAACDYCGTTNYNSNSFMPKKKQWDRSPFTSNTGMSRGGAWWLLASWLIRKTLLK